MIRRSASRALGAFQDAEDDVNPMENIANMSDVMLVLAVGIMLALVMHWNVNISGAVELEDAEVTSEEIQQSDSSAGDDEEQYEEVGTVYRDRETGEMYVVG